MKYGDGGDGRITARAQNTARRSDPKRNRVVLSLGTIYSEETHDAWLTATEAEVLAKRLIAQAVKLRGMP